MNCINDGNYTNATVIGHHGGRVPLCDDCLGTEPDAMYYTPTEIRAQRSHSRKAPVPSVVRPAAEARIGGPGAVVLELPEPPSANRWWRRHGTIMHLSKEAKAYKELVAAKIGRTGAPLFAETIPISIVLVWRRDRKSGDLDKRLGVLLDALQGNLYANDSQVVQIWARRCDEHPQLQPGTVRVIVEPSYGGTVDDL